MSFLDKIKRFFKRAREENENSSERVGAKKARYMSTPATIKFSPKQVHKKRIRRQYYCFNEYLDVTEDRNYEFKAGGMLLNEPTLRGMIQKYGSAFLNSEGGVLIGGVTDEGVVNGIRCSLRKEIELEMTVKSEFERFRPHVSRGLYIVKFFPVTRRDESIISDLKVVEIHVYKGDDDHLYETSKHEVYVRRDGGVQGPLRPLAIKDLVEQKYKKVLKTRQQGEKKLETLSEKCENKSEVPQNSSDPYRKEQNRKRKEIAMIDLTKDSPAPVAAEEKLASQPLAEKTNEQNIQRSSDQPGGNTSTAEEALIKPPNQPPEEKQPAQKDAQRLGDHMERRQAQQSRERPTDQRLPEKPAAAQCTQRRPSEPYPWKPAFEQSNRLSTHQDMYSAVNYLPKSSDQSHIVASSTVNYYQQSNLQRPSAAHYPMNAIGTVTNQPVRIRRPNFTKARELFYDFRRFFQ